MHALNHLPTHFFLSRTCDKMRTLAAVAVIVCALLVVAVRADERCVARCFASSVEWSAASTLDYEFALLPCDRAQPLISARFGDDDDAATAGDTPAFGCVAQEGEVALSLSAGDVHLEWRYRTAALCEEVLAAIDTIPGEFVGTRHAHGELVQEDGASLGDVQLAQCTEAACEPQCFALEPVVAVGVAGDKSPCGAAGTAECRVRVLAAVNPCDGGVVEKLDVLVGADEVPLHVYRPAALDGAQLSCVDGALQLASDGLMVTFEPADRAADCETLVQRLPTLASGRLSVLVLDLDNGEQWTLDASDSTSQDDDSAAETAPLSLAASAVECVEIAPARLNELDDGVLDSLGGVHIASVTPVPHPITPLINCSMHLANDYCCTVFGYHNPNPGPVTLAAGKPGNFFIPAPVDQGQETVLAANTTVPDAFSVIWHCPEYERHKLRWVLQVPAEGRHTWRRSVDAWRERQDCSLAQASTWCDV